MATDELTVRSGNIFLCRCSHCGTTSLTLHPEHIYEFQCSECGEFPTACWENANHEMIARSSKPASLFICHQCGTAYPTEDLAKDCCEPETFDAFECSECGEVSETDWEMEDHVKQDYCKDGEIIDGFLYICANCQEIYPDEFEARDCCEPQAIEIYLSAKGVNFNDLNSSPLVAVRLMC